MNEPIILYNIILSSVESWFSAYLMLIEIIREFHLLHTKDPLFLYTVTTISA